MNVLHTNDSSTTGDVPFLVWRWVWAVTGELWPQVYHGHLLIHNFVDISSITQKLWPPEVYQACSMQIRRGRTGCRCGAYVGLSESGCGKFKMFAFFFSLAYITTSPDITFWKHALRGWWATAPNMHCTGLAMCDFVHTILARSDAVATIYFINQFCVASIWEQQLLESNSY